MQSRRFSVVQSIALIPFLLPLLAQVSLGQSADAPPLPEAGKRPAAPETTDVEPTASRLDLGVQASVLTTSVAKLVERVKPSVVVVRFRGRNGKEAGLGSGFILSSDGMIATNRHVLGDGRAIEVQLEDGRVFPVTVVHASDRDLDLAVIKIDAKDLPALPLGDSSDLQQGQPVIAMGNPSGLANSVVAGLIAGRREIEGRSMIQLHIPIEPGNSGGPLLDLEGRVLGLLTLKSRVTAYLGYAMPVNDLQRLLDKPNPVPMSRWMTLGLINRTNWEILGAARWSQRAGRIQASGLGEWFGGRSLCLTRDLHDSFPLEVACEVKLGDESGAAGLAFHADGEDRHYGFYPTAGTLRLTRFDGPTVSTWKILEDIRTDAYRPGEWNRLRVRIDSNRVRCFVNGEQVIEHTRLSFDEGRIGLVKFRDTSAEFRRFQFGESIPVRFPTTQEIAQVTELIRDISIRRPPTEQLASDVIAVSPAASDALEEQARRLEQQADKLRQLATMVHVRDVQKKLTAELAQEDGGDLLKASLLIASLDNRDIDVETYLRMAEGLASAVRKQIPEEANDTQQLAALNRVLFNENGFHGSRTNYYHRSNSYMNEVIDDREGLPITLSVLYMEVGRRAGVDVRGVGLPGHFVVGLASELDKIEDIATLKLIDVFEGGTPIEVGKWIDQFERQTGARFDREMLLPQSNRAIAERMLRNLWNVALGQEDRESMLRYSDTILRLDDSNAEQRWYRALLELQTGRVAEAIADADWLLEHPSPEIDMTQLRQFRRHLDSLESD